MKRTTLVDTASLREFILPRGLDRTLIIGKRRDCDVKIPDSVQTSTVADQHCKVYRDKTDRAYVSDLGRSFYGTSLNGSKLDSGRNDSWEIKNMDELRLGDYLLRVRIEEEVSLK